LELLYRQGQDFGINTLPAASTAGMYQNDGSVEWNPHTFKMDLSSLHKMRGDRRLPIERAVPYRLADRFQKAIALMYGLQFMAKGRLNYHLPNPAAS
jgi:hypothetical protein